MKLWSKFSALFVLACFTTAYAQTAACSDLVKQALATVDTACAATERNQACYGNFSLTATARDDVQGFQFQKQGDRVDLADLASLQLQPFDLSNKLWGVALMKVQANLPDTLPGQNVTFLLFGDVKITNAVPASGPATADPLKPMQAFYFSTGVGQSNCAAAPTSGILIQTPKGAGKISLRANNADIRLGSTAFLRAQAGGKMTVSVVEGEGEMTADGETVTIPAGTESQVPLDEDLQAEDAPEAAEPYDADDVIDLPVEELPDEIEIAAPDLDVGTGDGCDESSDELDSSDGCDESSDELDSSDEFGESSDELDSSDEFGESSDELDSSDEFGESSDETISDESSDGAGDDLSQSDSGQQDGGSSDDSGQSDSSDDSGE